VAIPAVTYTGMFAKSRCYYNPLSTLFYGASFGVIAAGVGYWTGRLIGNLTK